MDTRQLIRLALLTALVAIANLAIRIPIPATEGYINVGDIPLLSWLLYWLVTGRIAYLGLGWIVAGYFLVEYYLYSLGPALLRLPGNIPQALASLSCGLPLTAIVQRSRLFGA